MAKKVLKLITAMFVLLMLWILVIWLLVSWNPNDDFDIITNIIGGIMMCGILLIYTYNILHSYVLEVCMKYKENKSVEE